MPCEIEFKLMHECEFIKILSQTLFQLKKNAHPRCQKENDDKFGDKIFEIQRGKKIKNTM